MSEQTDMGTGTGMGMNSGAGTGAVRTRIVDRGYQHYSGPRLGLAHATRVMTLAAVQRSLGIRQPFRAKLLPGLLIVLAFLPTIILLGVRILAPSLPTLPPYSSLYNRVALLYVLFAGLIAPDLLCADRRERVLSLYFSAPITRLHYVAARVLGLTAVMLLPTLAPMLILYLGVALLSPSAGDYLGGHLDDLWPIVLAGGVLALYYAAVALAVAAFTDRRAYASGIYLGLLLVSAAAVSIVVGLLRRSGSYPGHEWLQLLDLVTLPLRLVSLLFPARAGQDADPLNVWTYAAATAGVIALSLALLTWRYLRIRD